MTNPLATWWAMIQAHHETKRTSEKCKTACSNFVDGVNEILTDSLDYVRL